MHLAVVPIRRARLTSHPATSTDVQVAGVQVAGVQVAGVQVAGVQVAGSNAVLIRPSVRCMPFAIIAERRITIS